MARKWECGTIRCTKLHKTCQELPNDMMPFLPTEKSSSVCHNHLQDPWVNPPFPLMAELQSFPRPGEAPGATTIYPNTHCGNTDMEAWISEARLMPKELVLVSDTHQWRWDLQIMFGVNHYHHAWEWWFKSTESLSDQCHTTRDIMWNHPKISTVSQTLCL
jgi:hypothetical protein